jgi:hypothetical protein
VIACGAIHVRQGPLENVDALHPLAQQGPEAHQVALQRPMPPNPSYFCSLCSGPLVAVADYLEHSESFADPFFGLSIYRLLAVNTPIDSFIQIPTSKPKLSTVTNRSAASST